MDTDARRARRFLVTEYRELLTAVGRCADEVVQGWETDAVTDRARVTAPLESRLTAAGLVDTFPLMLRETAEFLEEDLAADPVAAPPYVIITSIGPIARATLARRERRVVVEVRVFEVDPETGEYRRTTTPVEESLRVRLRDTSDASTEG